MTPLLTLKAIRRLLVFILWAGLSPPQALSRRISQQSRGEYIENWLFGLVTQIANWTNLYIQIAIVPLWRIITSLSCRLTFQPDQMSVSLGPILLLTAQNPTDPCRQVCVHALVDSGAGKSYISDQLIRELGLPLPQQSEQPSKVRIAFAAHPANCRTDHNEPNRYVATQNLRSTIGNIENTKVLNLQNNKVVLHCSNELPCKHSKCNRLGSLVTDESAIRL